MNQSFGFLFYLKKPKNYAGGLLPIYVRITVDEQSVAFSLKRKCLPEKWNSHSGRMAETKEDARSLNIYIESMQGQIPAAY